MALDTETFDQLIETVRRFVAEKLVPREAEVADTDQMPADIVQEMRGLGLKLLIEVFEDVAFRLAPFGREEALRMIDETKGAKILKGARGAPRADIGALADALVALSLFATEHAASLASVDMNPFVVLPEGKGAMALDCLVVTRKPE